MRIQALASTASRGGGAARVGGKAPAPGLVGGWACGLALALLGACAWWASGAAPRVVATAPAPSAAERYCAWFAHAHGGILYFGEAAFWSAYRAAGGDPEGDLRAPGPQLVGRFDLARGALLEPIEVGDADSRSGVWDVFVHDDGRLYFTTYFDAMGSVDPAGGEVRRFEALGPGLNEIAAGPGGDLLVSRYGRGADADGSVVRISPGGALVQEFPIPAPPGFRSAPKTVAYDALRREIWVTTDLLPREPGPARHDAVVLDHAGRVARRIETPEIQFVAFGEDGTGYRAEVEGSRLSLRVAPPAGPQRSVLLDGGFAADADFAQDIQPASDGRVVVTRWSGVVHVVDRHGAVRTLRLPALDPDGLYYTGVLAGERVCVTYCGDVTVVCEPVP